MNQTGELLQSVCVILNYTTNPIKYDIMHLWNKKKHKLLYDSCFKAGPMGRNLYVKKI